MFDGNNLILITDVDQDKSANNLGPVRVPKLQINNPEKLSRATIGPPEARHSNGSIVGRF